MKKPKPKPKCSRLRRVAKAAAERALQEGQNPKLAERAEVIRTYCKRVLTDIIEIGRQLTLAQNEVARGKWPEWLEKEFAWSESTALNFMRAYELAEDRNSVNFTKLRIAPSALYVIARPNTPSKVVDDIIARAEAGESIEHKHVQEALHEYGEPDAADNGDRDKDDDEQELSESASETTEPRTKNDARWFKKLVDDANEAIRRARIADSVLEPEAERSLREVVEPSRELLKTLRQGGQALIKLADFLEALCQKKTQPLAAAE